MRALPRQAPHGAQLCKLTFALMFRNNKQAHTVTAHAWACHTEVDRLTCHVPDSVQLCILALNPLEALLDHAHHGAALQQAVHLPRVPQEG